MEQFRKLVEAGPIGLQDWAEEKLRSYAKEIVHYDYLPQSEDEDDTRLKKAGTLIDIATGHDANALALTEELEAFLKQYPLHRKDLIEKMKAQYKPVLDEKSDKLSKQYGTEVHLTYENDKEFMELARQNLERLEAQYNATLANAKKQLRSIAGLN